MVLEPRSVILANGGAQDTRQPSVAHVVSYYPPDRVGGVGEHVRVIHEGHLELGIESTVLTSGETRTDPTVHRVGRSPRAFFLQSWRLTRRAMSCDVIHAHHGEGLLLLLLVRMRRRRPRILMMFHVDVRQREKASGPHVFDGRRFGPGRVADLVRRFIGLGKALVDRFAWVLADAVVVETESVRQELSDLAPSRDVTVVPHGLGQPRPVPHSNLDAVELLFVGTPGLRKRTHLLPTILYRVRESVPEARLRIVGFDIDGDPSLTDEAERLGLLKAIEFVGSVRSEEVVPYYRAADVLVLPSAYEGLPMVLLEAMREGLVPVATEVSGHPEAIVDGQNGFLVPLDDVDTLGNRCVLLLQDAKTLEFLEGRAVETVRQQFSVERELEAYVDLYLGLSSSRSRLDTA